MKKIVFALLALTSTAALFAQSSSNSGSNFISKASDHIMLQVSYDRWPGMADTLKKNIGGLPRGGNIYFMLDKPVSKDKRFSLGFGLGIGTSNIYFKGESIGMTLNTSTLQFSNVDSTTHFKKYKLTTAYLDAPLELRFTDKPAQNGKSWKAAVGLKLGLLLNAHTKGKTLVTNTGSVISTYTEKQSDKHFFNTARVAATARFGYGNFSLFGSYSVTGLLKDGNGLVIHPLQIGLCISGL